ncbi:hypothetical protein ES703_26046 [subsurface metagenome]
MKRIGFIDARRMAGFKLEGTVALTGVNIPISDTATPSSGNMRGIHINYTQSGVKTGTAVINPLSIAVTISADVPYIFPFDITVEASADKVHTMIAPINVYLKDVGNNCQHAAVALFGREITNVGIASDSFLWMRNHGAVEATAFLKSTGKATYLIDFGAQDMVVPLSDGSDSVNCSHKLRVRMPDGSTRYFHLFTD